MRHPAGVDEEKAETGVAAAQQPGRAHGDADEVVLPQKVLPRAAGDGTRVVVVGLYTNEGAVSFLISIFFPYMHFQYKPEMGRENDGRPSSWWA